MIYQAAALHVLTQARDANLGVATMRTMTAGMFHALHSSSRPGWQAAHDLYKVAFKIVRSDSRIHLPMFGMRWPEEVARHVAIVENREDPLF